MQDAITHPTQKWTATIAAQIKVQLDFQQLCEPLTNLRKRMDKLSRLCSLLLLVLIIDVGESRTESSVSKKTKTKTHPYN